MTVEAASGVTIPHALAVEAITFSPELPAEVRTLAESTAVWMGDIVKAVADQLRRLFGAAAATPRHIIVTDWSAEQYTSPRAPSSRAATTSYGHPLYQQATAGRIHWASTEASAQYAGHIEGALRAGQRPARAVLDAIEATHPTPSRRGPGSPIRLHGC